ncbi:MAG: YbaK/EbsC family protein [Alphaproteobacteria bacterium]|nr:YbaK/EbsC family protein [Alphaproteobacteria bacterium]
MSGPLASASVERVRAALVAASAPDTIVALDHTARTAEDAAKAVDCPLGAIVKTLAFMVDDRLVLALVAGDRRCDALALGRAFGSASAAARADADRVRAATGFAIGGVAPIGHPQSLPVAVDPSLARFATLYAAAGHAHCVFVTAYDSLLAMTGGTPVPGLGIEARPG